MKNENLTKFKSAFLIQEAFSLLPQDKENPSIEKKILRIDQWNVADTQINLIETDSLMTTMLLSQKWPFQLLNHQKREWYAFMAGNDQVLKQKVNDEKNSKKSLLNLSILLKLQKDDQPLIAMTAANVLIKCLQSALRHSSQSKQIRLQIRWRHDILLNHQKIGELSLRHVCIQDHYYSQLNIQVNVKQIPKNFGAYDFLPTYLQKYLPHQLKLTTLAHSFISSLAIQLSKQVNLHSRVKEVIQEYISNLIYFGERVVVYDMKYQHIHWGGRFIGVTDEGHAVVQGREEPVRDGVMKFQAEKLGYLKMFTGAQ